MVIKVFDGEVEMRRSPTKVFHEQLYSSPSVLYLCLLAHAYKVAIQSVTQTFLSSEFYKSSRRCYQHNKLFLIFRCLDWKEMAARIDDQTSDKSTPEASIYPDNQVYLPGSTTWVCTTTIIEDYIAKKNALWYFFAHHTRTSCAS